MMARHRAWPSIALMLRVLLLVVLVGVVHGKTATTYRTVEATIKTNFPSSNFNNEEYVSLETLSGGVTSQVMYSFPFAPAPVRRSKGAAMCAAC